MDDFVLAPLPNTLFQHDNWVRHTCVDLARDHHATPVSKGRPQLPSIRRPTAHDSVLVRLLPSALADR